MHLGNNKLLLQNHSAHKMKAKWDDHWNIDSWWEFYILRFWQIFYGWTKEDTLYEFRSLIDNPISQFSLSSPVYVGCFQFSIHMTWNLVMHQIQHMIQLSKIEQSDKFEDWAHSWLCLWGHDMTCIWGYGDENHLCYCAYGPVKSEKLNNFNTSRDGASLDQSWP